MVPCLSFLATCADDSKPYMIVKALDESYKNHIGFAIIRASDEPGAATAPGDHACMMVTGGGVSGVRGAAPRDFLPAAGAEKFGQTLQNV